IHACARFVRSGRDARYASIPRNPISWPLNAANRQSRAGAAAASVRIVSSQHASPHNLPKIRQPTEADPSIISEKTIADLTRVVEQTGILEGEPSPHGPAPTEQR